MRLSIIIAAALLAMTAFAISSASPGLSFTEVTLQPPSAAGMFASAD